MSVLDGVKVVELAEHGFVPSCGAILADWGGPLGDQSPARLREGARPGSTRARRRSAVRHWPPLCRALGFDDLIEDPRFVDTAARRANSGALHALISERIRSRPLAEVVGELAAEDTLFATMASPLEVIDDPQVAANGYLAQHPTVPGARLATAPMQFDDEMTRVTRAAPELGEHTEEVLAEIGLRADDIRALRAEGTIA
ncbi:MAG: CoA transferase [Acidimicrobiia bacterium]